MSVLIKGMKMPQKCGQCKLYHVEHPMYCMAVEGHRTVGAPYGMPRPDWCPLVEVPEPSYTDEWCHDCSEYDKDHHCCHRWAHVIRKTVEELQLVHCKDCVYYDSDNRMCLDMIGFGRRWEETDYCSYGRRKE